MISVIIPALNEERALPATLDTLFAQRGEFEAILVDGGSYDATLRIAAGYPRLRVLRTLPGRARQMNAGAAQARGDWLLFLHADTLLPAGALLAIAALPEDVSVGGFRHKFAGRGWLLRLISWMHNRRCAATWVFFGDQAMFFRRNLFFNAGAFPEDGLMEDLVLSRRLVTSLPAGARPRLMPSYVTTDARKFRQMGVLRSFWRVAVILTCLELKRPLPYSALRFFQDIR